MRIPPTLYIIDDFLAFIIQGFQENEREHQKIVNSSNTIINVTSPENQNRTIRTMPANIAIINFANTSTNLALFCGDSGVAAAAAKMIRKLAS